MNKVLSLIIIFLSTTVLSYGQNLSAKDIVKKMNDRINGGRIQSTMKMTIIRPSWTQNMELKSWGDGDDFSLILITSPARDKGITYLKREKEMWNFQPSIDRTIKMPPSMMTQSWMGSDFKNDDLVRQVSIIDDYTHKLLGKETIEGRECYKIELVPNADAAVVWGKVIAWIDTKDFLQLKTESYDEDMDLVQTMLGTDIKVMGGKLMATKNILLPADKEGHKTIMEYISIEFDVTFDERFFSTQNMKRVH